MLNPQICTFSAKKIPPLSDLILDVQGLETQFNTPEGIVHAVNGVSFGLQSGETLGLVGESGCGKTLTMLSVLRLIASPPGKITAGKVFFGQDLLQMPTEKIRQVRCGQVVIFFSRPNVFFKPSLDNRCPDGGTIIAPFWRQARARSIELLEKVGFPKSKDRLPDFPHQFSGELRQRVMIAMALSCDPMILIADEPTTALIVTIQAQIIELVKRLRDEMRMAFIWLTHDLGVIAGLAQRVSVMYGGYLIEEALVEDLYAHPQHPYTIGLLTCSL